MNNTHRNSSILLLIFMIWFGGCKEDKVQLVQLVKNGNVESGITYPYNWDNNDADKVGTAQWTDEESYSGQKSLKLSKDDSDANDFFFWSQTMNEKIPFNKDITLKVKIKGTLRGRGVSIVIRSDNTDRPTGVAEQIVSTQDIIPISGAFDWTEYHVTLNNVDIATHSITVYLLYQPSTAGTAYFDDISLEY